MRTGNSVLRGIFLGFVLMECAAEGAGTSQRGLTCSFFVRPALLFESWYGPERLKEEMEAIGELLTSEGLCEGERLLGALNATTLRGYLWCRFRGKPSWALAVSVPRVPVGVLQQLLRYFAQRGFLQLVPTSPLAGKAAFLGGFRGVFRIRTGKVDMASDSQSFLGGRKEAQAPSGEILSLRLCAPVPFGRRETVWISYDGTRVCLGRFAVVLPPFALRCAGMLGAATMCACLKACGPTVAGHRVCASHLLHLWGLVVSYARAQGGLLHGGGPSGLAAFQRIAETFGRQVPERLFWCPLSGIDRPFRLPNGVLRITARSCSYRMRSSGLPLSELGPDLILLYEARPFDGSGRWVLLGNGEARWIPEAAFQAAAKRQRLFR